MKTTIGTLILSPVKEDGKFLFCNNAITINGKTSKGDRVCILVENYEVVNGKHFVKKGQLIHARIIVRGEEHLKTLPDGDMYVEDYYVQLSEFYKSSFYFGKKSSV